MGSNIYDWPPLGNALDLDMLEVYCMKIKQKIITELQYRIAISIPVSKKSITRDYRKGFWDAMSIVKTVLEDEKDAIR